MIIRFFPDRFIEMLRRKNLFRMCGKQQKQRILRVGQLDRDIVYEYLQGVGVNCQLTDKERGFLLRGGRVRRLPLIDLIAPQQRFDAADELAVGKGFREIVVPAAREAERLVAVCGAGA